MKKVGISSKNILQGDALTINKDETYNIKFVYTADASATYSLPEEDGNAGDALITDGAGNLSFGTVSSSGNIGSLTGEAPKIAYFDGSYSIAPSSMEQGTGQLLFPGGSTASPGISFILDEDTGIIKSGVNEVGIVAGGVIAAEFKAGGLKVGDITYTRTDGLAGQTIVTDGAGNLSWDSFVGTDGATGPTGATGADGIIGVDGATGATGPAQALTIFGTFSSSDMTGTPLTYDVTMSATMSDYVVLINSETPRTWTIESKAEDGFTVNSNSITTFDETIYWSSQESIL